jgi:hypothetical protein
MAVTMAPIANRLWQGLSTDTKPTGAKVLVNDVFYQTDSQTFYVYTAQGTWVLSASSLPLRTY